MIPQIRMIQFLRMASPELKGMLTKKIPRLWTLIRKRNEGRKYRMLENKLNLDQTAQRVVKQKKI